jgi:hypothetical protein
MQDMVRIMNKYALVINSVVQTIIIANAPSDYPDVANNLIACSDDVQANWTYNGSQFSPVPAPTISEIINARILNYEKIGPDLARQIKVTNTLAGITTIQSVQVMKDFGLILQMVREGMLPTAIYALQQSAPSGFVTQDMINLWISMLQGAL